MDEMFLSALISMESNYDATATSVPQITWPAKSEAPFHVPGSPMILDNISVTPDNAVLAPMPEGTSWMNSPLLALSGTTIINCHSQQLLITVLQITYTLPPFRTIALLFT